MTTVHRIAGAFALMCAVLAGCGGGSGTVERLNVDYSALKIAESTDAPLEYARSDEQLARPLRNGLRLQVGGGGVVLPAGTTTAANSVLSSFSSTTVQVDAVDEADSVKYDGTYIYTARQEEVLTPASFLQGLNVLDITRTNPVTADFETVNRFVIEGEQSLAPQLYLLANAQATTEYVVAVSQNVQAWVMPVEPVDSLVTHPDHTTIQLLDVRDPRNVSQAWKLQLDGWMRATRMIGDTLYVVSSYRPRIPDLVFPADTLEKKLANERLIRSTPARDLLPAYTENDGARQPLTVVNRCLVPQLEDNQAYLDLLVVTAVNVRTRRVTDMNCLSTNIDGVYVAQQSLYVGGTGTLPAADGLSATVLHKFALENGQITYRATGAVLGSIGWTNPSYFMDERNGDLRIVTSFNGSPQLGVFREGNAHTLVMVSRLPNAAHPTPIGRPGESLDAVRFIADRAYIVTFRVTDPLTVIDLHDPADPVVAGELFIPGVSAYLRPLGAEDSQLLLSVGQDAPNGRREGIKIELFDVQDIAHPRSIGAKVFGHLGSSTDALRDPHAVTFQGFPDAPLHWRLALPIAVFDTPNPVALGSFHWTYSGLHLLEIAPDGSGAPQLHFQGVIKTGEASAAQPLPPFAPPERGVLHGDSVYAIHGDRVLSSLWQDLNP